MRNIGIVFVVSFVLMVSAFAAGSARADNSSDSAAITPVVLQGETDRFGGGDWVLVKAGNTNFGVVYGTQAHENKIYIVADYKRYIAGVDFYDAQGNFLRTKGIPVWTTFAQTLERMVEFKDVDGNYRFDLRRWDQGEEVTSDVPIKELNLVQAWALSDLTNETVDDVLFVNFTLSISNVHYTWVWSPVLKRPILATPAEGTVSLVEFTFHIRVAVEQGTANIPWFDVVITGGDERRVANRTFAGWREFTGPKVNMTVKYDHEIQGWDFVNNESRLLLETRLLLGQVVPREMLERYRLHRGIEAREGEGGNLVADDRSTLSPEPRSLPPVGRQGAITFGDDWYRIGRLTWASDVMVDGEQEEMYFQIHGGGPVTFEYNRAAFVGAGVVGAFVYPAGDSIFHDPGLEAVSYEFGITTVTNISPVGILALQLVVVSAAIVGAVLIRMRRKGRM